MISRVLLRVRDAVTPSQAVVGPVPEGTFVKGINLGGEAVRIEGRDWESYAEALAHGLTVSDVTAIALPITPSPYVPRPVRTMLGTAICQPQTLELSQALPNGVYRVYLWMIENYRTDWHSLTVRIGQQVVATDIGKLPLGQWACYGPYAATVTTGQLAIAISSPSQTVDAHVMGVSIFRQDSP